MKQLQIRYQKPVNKGNTKPELWVSDLTFLFLLVKRLKPLSYTNRKGAVNSCKQTWQLRDRLLQTFRNLPAWVG